MYINFLLLKVLFWIIRVPLLKSGYGARGNGGYRPPNRYVHEHLLFGRIGGAPYFWCNQRSVGGFEAVGYYAGEAFQTIPLCSRN